MRKATPVILFFFLVALTGWKSSRQEVKLECIKRQHATRVCHYNFLIDDMPYHFVDNGCKSKKEDILKKAEAGKLAMAKDWKIECHTKKIRDGGV
jgi:hypothetical protein